MQRSLWPREHGAYVQLLAPLATALAIGPTVPGLLFATAACTAFLAHEALMVARGARGMRRREVDGVRATGRVRLWGGITLGSTIAALVLAPRTAIQLIPLVALPTTLVALLAGRRALHTLAGEVLAAAALSGAAVPVAASGGLPCGDVLVLWIAWTIGFATTIVVIRGMLASHRSHRSHRSSRRELLAPRRTVLALLSILVWLVIAALIMPLAAVAIPLVVAGAVIEMAAPSARSLQSVGITLACVSVLAGGIAIYVA